MKTWQITLYIWICIACLAVIGIIFPPNGVKIGKINLTFIHPSEVIKVEKHNKIDVDEIYQQNIQYLQNLHLQSMQDSITALKNFALTHASRVYFPNNDYHYFDKFFNKLDSSANKEPSIHIFHYGDSQIEMDRITGVIREQMQKQFGGYGPGIIPAIQPIPSFTVNQNYQGIANKYALYGDTNVRRAPHNKYGVLASFVHSPDFLQINFSTNNTAFEHAKKFNRVKLLIGNNTDTVLATLSTNGLDSTKIIYNINSGSNTIQWDLPSYTNSGTLSIKGSIDIYGISLESKTGVTIDNVPMRGAAGTFFSSINSEMMKYFYKNLNTQLIILQFGGNAMYRGITKKQIEYYAQNIGKQIKYFQNILPDVPILFIGPSDMSENVQGKMQTRHFLVEMINALRDTVINNGAAFWNTFEAMGGENSMVAWANMNPPLASPDYIHFSKRGADRIGEMLYESINNYYLLYKLEKNISNKDNILPQYLQHFKVVLYEMQ